jgi:hypothetical protein
MRERKPRIQDFRQAAPLSQAMERQATVGLHNFHRFVTCEEYHVENFLGSAELSASA